MLRIALGGRIDDAAHQQINPDARQIEQHEGLDRRRVDRTQEIGTRNAADHARDQQAEEQFLVDIPVQQMADPRGGGGEAFDQMDALRRQRGGHAEQADHQRVGDDAEGHTERAINYLRSESNENEGKQVCRKRRNRACWCRPCMRPRI